MTEKEV